MLDYIKQKWVKKRYKKRKPVEINQDTEIGVDYIDLVVIDGEEDKEGLGLPEINFEHIHKENDIMCSVTPCEIETVQPENGLAVFWFDREKLEKEEEFYIYYGCRNKWARLFDRFFIKEKGYGDEVVMVQHLYE